jgi:hypothetical protein
VHLNLIRDPSYNSATVGRLLIDGIFECWTLEDQVREDDSQQVEVWKVRGQTAIPRGEYVVVIDFSNRFRQEMPRLLNVPGFDGIRIHAGNTHADTEGCILVGKTKGTDRVGMSRAAYCALFDKLERAYTNKEQITMEVE